MGSKSKAPEYATTTYNTGGLFGSSTASKDGVTFNPTDWQKDMGTLSSNLVNSSLQGLSSNNYLNDENFKIYKNDFDNQLRQSFDSNVLSPLANRGLMRSSGLQGATNSFNDTMANQLTNLMDSYYNRQVNNLASALNAQNTLYNYLMGINTGAQNQSNSVSGYNMNKYKAENSGNGSLFGSLSSSLGNLGSLATGIGNLKNGNNKSST